MKNVISKAVSFGLGMAVASKEQVEKFADDMVKRGELGKSESKQFVEDMLEKGELARTELEQQIQLRIRQRLAEMDLATKEDIRALEQRLELLERNNISNP